MDRRFLTWLMLTTALCFLYLSMRPKPPEPKPEPEAAILSEDPLLRDGDAPPLAEVDAIDAAQPAGDQQPAAVKPDFPGQAITLGSMDPAQGYQLLLTLTSRGGGLERAELVGQQRPGKFQYRALEHDGGYLGYLGLTETTAGLRVRTVPDGSPAAKATSSEAAGGLQVDDILLEFAGKSVNSVEALEAALRAAKSGQDQELVVQRSVDGNTKSLKYKVTLCEAPLDILRMRPFSSEEVAGNASRPSLRTTLGSLSGTRIPTGKHVLPALRETLTMDWGVRPLEVAGGQGVEFYLPLDSFLAGTSRPSQFDLVKRYRLLPAGEQSDGFMLDLETVIVNRNDQEVNLSFRQEGVAGLTLEGWWYSVKISPSFFSGAGNRDVAYANQLANSHTLATTREIYARAQKTPNQPDIILLSEGESLENRSLQYIGLDAQYFNASLLAHPDSPDALTNLRQAGATALANVDEIVKAKSQATNTSFWFDTSEKAIPAGGELSQRYQVFIGPKDSEILAAHNLGDAIEYGWFPYIAKPLSAVLHFFYAIVRNYGLAIVLLTVMVRGAMFPLGRKAAMNAQRMQELQPELQKINEMYKDNMEKRAKAMQELYAKHNFKPLAGCLPMFIQLPIFIGLYRCLSVDISLRQAPLIPGVSWCSNLAGPDQLIEWSSWMPEFIAGRGTGWLGPYFNILPMVTVALFLLQQKMLMPKATDEQTRMTQNMMQVMTIFMGVLFFKVPSGLCIYFITSSLWSLIERKLVKRLTPPSNSLTSDAKTQRPETTGSEAATNKGNAGRKSREATPAKPKSRLQEMVELLEKPAVKSSTQRGSAKGKRRRR